MATGTVTEFDDPKGWGTVTADDGAEHFFHCSAIADGTRPIDAVGAPVRFATAPGASAAGRRPRSRRSEPRRVGLAWRP